MEIPPKPLHPKGESVFPRHLPSWRLMHPVCLVGLQDAIQVLDGGAGATLKLPTVSDEREVLWSMLSRLLQEPAMAGI